MVVAKKKKKKKIGATSLKKGTIIFAPIVIFALEIFLCIHTYISLLDKEIVKWIKMIMDVSQQTLKVLEMFF